MSELSLAMKDFRAAQRHSKICYDMVPNDPRVLSVYGEVCLRIGKVDEGLDALKLALELDPIPQGKTNADTRHASVLFGHFMSRNKDACLEEIENLDQIDSKSWLITAKICSDEKHELESLNWFEEGKNSFEKTDWKQEVENFRMNNDGATKALIEFAESLYK